MKKTILKAAIAVCLLAACSATAGTSVSAEKALKMVDAWMAENRGGFGLGGATAVSAKPFLDDDGTVLGYAVTLSGGGCVFTSADTRIEPVVAFSENCDGELPAGHPLRGMLKSDLRGRLAALSASSGSAVLQSASSSSAARSKWARYTGAKMLQAVTTPNGNPPFCYAYLPGFSNAKPGYPYLTHWTQSTSSYAIDEQASNPPWTIVYKPTYNRYTPNHYVCGCVATATSTILQFFGAPEGPVGMKNGCTINGEGVELATIGGTYDWSILPANMGGAAPVSTALSDEQIDLLGRVAYDAGVLLSMAYDSNGTGSGAGGTSPARVLTRYFGFKTAEGASADSFEQVIYSQLRCGAPVILSLDDKNSTGPGHEVIAVGYGKDAVGGEYTRVFMGWAGSSDAWYNLPDVPVYNNVNGVVTKISRDGACEPFYGQVKTAEGVGVVGAKVTIGSTNVLTGANGLFGIRLTKEAAAAVASITVTCGSFTTNIAVAASGGDDSGEDGEEAGEDEEDAGPSEIVVTLPAGTEAVAAYASPNDAITAAVNSKPARALLLVSGGKDSPESAEVVSWLAANAATVTNRFAVYYADQDTDGYFLQNAPGSVGVFNPLVFDVAKGWQPDNGRYAYLTPTGSVEEVGAQLEAVLNTSADKWNGVLQGATLVVMGAEKFAAVEGPFCEPAPGTYAYTNGQMVTVSCPSVFFTNEVAGVVYKCTGWKLVEGDYLIPEPPAPSTGAGLAFVIEEPEEEDDDDADAVASGTGTTATFALAFEKQTLVWKFEPAYYHVVVDVADDFVGDLTVSPADSWIAVGADMTLMASAVPGSTYRFWQWREVEIGSFKEIEWREDLDDREAYESAVVHLTIDAPRHIVAWCREGESEGKAVTITGMTPGAAAITVYLSAGEVTLSPTVTNMVDATGTNWVCTGWTSGTGDVAASGSEAKATFTLADSASLTWTWEPHAAAVDVETTFEIDWTSTLDNLSGSYSTNLVSLADLTAAGKTLADIQITAPLGFKASVASVGDNVVATLALDEDVLRPAVGSGLTIVPNGDGTVTVTGSVVNGVKGFWYALYSTDDLNGTWSLVGEYTSGQPAEQAPANAAINVSIDVAPTAMKCFYKLRVTDVNPAAN